MAELHSRMRTYIFSSYCFFFLFLFVFPRLISAVGHWMSTILPHMKVEERAPPIFGRAAIMLGIGPPTF